MFKVITILLFDTSAPKFKITNLFLCPANLRLVNSVVFLCLDVRNFSLELFCEKCGRFYVHLAAKQPALGHWRVQLKSPTLLKRDVIGYVLIQKFAKQIFCHTPAEAYSEPSRTSNMKLFTKIVNGWKLLNIFVKRSIVDVGQGSESVSDLWRPTSI